MNDHKKDPKPTCHLPECKCKVVYRGLCGGCFEHARSLVRGGLTTWDKLESEGKCSPSKRGLASGCADLTVARTLPPICRHWSVVTFRSCKRCSPSSPGGHRKRVARHVYFLGEIKGYAIIHDVAHWESLRPPSAMGGGRNSYLAQRRAQNRAIRHQAKELFPEGSFFMGGNEQ